MLKKCVLLGLVSSALAVPARAQISVYLGIAPPPVRFEAPPPPPPAMGVMWVPGFWAPAGNHYRWVGGHYERPPYPGAVWMGPHYERGDRGYGYRQGFWSRPVIVEEHGRGHAYGHFKDRDDHDDNRGHSHGHGHDRD